MHIKRIKKFWLKRCAFTLPQLYSADNWNEHMAELQLNPNNSIIDAKKNYI